MERKDNVDLKRLIESYKVLQLECFCREFGDRIKLLCDFVERYATEPGTSWYIFEDLWIIAKDLGYEKCCSIIEGNARFRNPLSYPYMFISMGVRKDDKSADEAEIKRKIGAKACRFSRTGYTVKEMLEVLRYNSETIKIDGDMLKGKMSFFANHIKRNIKAIGNGYTEKDKGSDGQRGHQAVIRW